MKLFPLVAVSILSTHAFPYGAHAHVDENQNGHIHEVIKRNIRTNNEVPSESSIIPIQSSASGRALSSTCPDGMGLFEISLKGKSNYKLHWWLLNDCDFSSEDPVLLQGAQRFRNGHRRSEKSFCIPLTFQYSFVIKGYFNSAFHGKRGAYVAKFNGKVIEEGVAHRDQYIHTFGAPCDRTLFCGSNERLLEITTRTQYDYKLFWHVKRECDLEHIISKESAVWSGIDVFRKVNMCLSVDEAYVATVRSYRSVPDTPFWRIKFDGNTVPGTVIYSKYGVSNPDEKAEEHRHEINFDAAGCDDVSSNVPV